ncbi:MAG: sulfatase [Deltaproteobacteria bacterium]|nr:sulfatase [Deltaproteobacteria bacterium]
MKRAAHRNACAIDSMSPRFDQTHRAGQTSGWLLAFGLILGTLGCADPTHDPVRNVILISCDTLRADRLGMYGYEREVSPNLDAFARQSVVFERAYATAPHTNPALSSLLTSRMPDELGVSGGNRTLMPSSVSSLPEILAEAGIQSAAIVSNWALRRPDPKLGDVGIAQGFEHFDDTMGSSAGLREGHFERIADATTDAAISWLEQNRNDTDRFFLWVHYQDPHGPYTPPERFRGLFTSEGPGGLLPQLGQTQQGYRQIPHYQIQNGERRPDFYRNRYDEEIRFFDDEVGRLLAWLESHGVYEDSLVVFTADHGESLGEHQYWFTHEANLYDEEVRVPLVIRYPKGLPSPSGENLVGHLDFLPSVLDALGLPEVPARGISLIARSLPSGRILPHSLHRPDSPQRWFALTDERYRLVIPRSGPQLYDLREDPAEQRDLAEENPQRIKAMIDRYGDFMAVLPTAPAVEEIVAPLDDESRRALEALGYLPARPRASDAAAKEGP